MDERRGFVLGVATLLGSMLAREAVRGLFVSASKPMLALLLGIHNWLTVLGFSAFIALSAPLIDEYTTMIAMRTLPSRRYAKLRRRDAWLKSLLLRQPGALALPLSLAIIALSLAKSGATGPGQLLPLLVSPHTYLEFAAIYFSLRCATLEYLEGRGCLPRTLALAFLALLAGGAVEVWVFPRIMGALGG